MIKRYDVNFDGCCGIGEYCCDLGLIEDSDGEAVLYEDHAAEVERLRAEVERLRAEIERFRRDNEMACENTPWLGCECPGCETARARAVAASRGRADG